MEIDITLSEVTVYLIKTLKGFALIDAVLNTPEAFLSLKEALNGIGLKPVDINSIYLTHYHLDHLGLCKKMEEFTSIDIHIHEREKIAFNFMSHHLDTYPKKLEKFFKDYGVPEKIITNIKNQILFYKNLLKGPERIFYFQEGQNIELGYGRLEVLTTPGHTPGHCSFFYPEEGFLFSGDFLLKNVWPHVGIYPHNPRNYNPLKEYLDALNKIMELDIRTIFPSHGEFIHEPKKRIFQVKNFIMQKLDSIIYLFSKIIIE